jgi:antitoxin ParD1/3/4
MRRHTFGFALPQAVRKIIRDLVRRDQEEQAKRRLRDLVEEGLASGPGRRRTSADKKGLLAIARGEID